MWLELQEPVTAVGAPRLSCGVEIGDGCTVNTGDETVTGSLYGIAGDLVGLGAEVPAPLRAELPAAVHLALPGGSAIDHAG